MSNNLNAILCSRRPLDSDPCGHCRICTTVIPPPKQWKDTGDMVYSVIPLNERTLDESRFQRYYVPYIRVLEAAKPRTYLINHSNDRDIAKWIQDAVPVVEDHQIHFPDCKDTQCSFRSLVPTQKIPMHGWNAYSRLGNHAYNPHITYGRHDSLWEQAIRRGAEEPEQKSYGNVDLHNIHRDITLDYEADDFEV